MFKIAEGHIDSDKIVFVSHIQKVASSATPLFYFEIEVVTGSKYNSELFGNYEEAVKIRGMLIKRIKEYKE